MFSWRSAGVWLLRVRRNNRRLWLPVPMYVLSDALYSLEDLCALILPGFGLPNYASVLRQALLSLGETEEALFDVEANGVGVCARRVA